jgi:hypothetical protein
VYAANTNSGVGNTGVTGNCDTAGGIGVVGTSINGNGVYGTSGTGYGVLGYSTGGPASLSGISTTANIPAFAGGNSSPSGLAASFAGTVFISGRLVVSDPSYKSGLLAHPDGSHRLVYCVESPESWIEDFGTGQLTNGKAEIRLDPDFAAVVQTGDYRAFPVAEGDCKGLYVASKTASGFEVRELQGGTSNVGFSWRVVAKPKTEKKLNRLEKFTPPNVRLPDLATLPKPDAHPPTMPDAFPQTQPPSRPSPAPAVSQGSGETKGGTSATPVPPMPQPRSG